MTSAIARSQSMYCTGYLVSIGATINNMTRQPENNVDAYIDRCSAEVQAKLFQIRQAIREVAPDATERTDYFQIPGYSYEGYDYNGMFVWFSYQKQKIRLHLRPPVIENHKLELTGFKTTKGIVSFPVNATPTKSLIKKLVRASLKTMKTTIKA
jgi:uncharacterized protein YdhG (YjbR/CyaY superfamily)